MNNPEQDRLFLMCCWNSLVVFISVVYLTGGIFKATMVGAFVLGSCLLGFGQRWLLPTGFAVSILAIAVALGFPHPEQWPDLVKSAPDLLKSAQTLWASLANKY